ncbi:MULTISPECIES: hypothetical protein [Streptomyces]|jgi:hypothetical protein|uniref:Uncharacterized protein n=2 Tax=Streptomyces TaxID=1883 RepID=A0A250VAJ3_STROL|nr:MULTISPECIES: hypothetical protein [Streptomyces]KPI21281.1 hypothetical protein OK006_1766 [Actinobacteria bacterium OK006]KAF5994971.1 hypothetical protein BOG92_027440 [Streptomyces sp. WAC00263]KUN46309.1 hypothetical protein AQJ27_16450 [Streptomyces olivochromogenes]MCT9105642.1 hypothetical protein [Streptomyces mirabilis]MCX4421597.1 hypothetical protein [Streptomyces mirabilis]
MNTVGTIDRPLTHDPKKQAPMKPSTSEPAGSAIPDFTTTGANDSRQNRTREMQLIPEALARAHMHERLHEAERERLAVRLASARRMQRRAERASMRARRALAMAVMH